MASSKDYLSFILEQLSGLEDISYRAMMGEYILYYQGKVIGGIYDSYTIRVRSSAVYTTTAFSSSLLSRLRR